MRFTDVHEDPETARAGLPLATPAPPADTIHPEPDLGERLWTLVAEAVELGLDPEAELRRVALARLAQARTLGGDAESSSSPVV